jgi:glutathione S-transferase
LEWSGHLVDSSRLLAGLCKKIGAEHTSLKGDQPHYTLPVIYDPNTNTAVSDSYNIAKYLDEHYPDTPTAIPRGTEVFQAM